jgi:membrane-bound inhibitor of C-type lysozyme
LGCALVALALSGCLDNPSKEEQEAAKNTIVCHLQGERVVIRFDLNEARMLMPGGDRIVLYQVQSVEGLRFSNGDLELRGKGTEFTLIDHRTAVQVPLADCAPYSLPTKQ